MESPNPDRRTWQEDEARRPRAKRACHWVAFYIFSGMPIDWQVVGDQYRPKQKLPIATVRRWLNQEEARVLIMESLTDMMNAAGLTKQKYLKTLAGAYEDMQTDAGRGDWLKMVGRIHAMEVDPVRRSQSHSIQEHGRLEQRYDGPEALPAARDVTDVTFKELDNDD